MGGEECVLLGGVGWYVQGLLGLLSFGTLVVKRQLERPKRAWLIWFLDASKQAVGALFVHFLNMIFAASQASWSTKGDACEWYWLNLVLDTTLGVGLSYLILRWMLATRRTKFGTYGDPPSAFIWFDQLRVWLLVTFLMKVSCLFLLTLSRQILIPVAQFVLQNMNPTVKLLVVMIVSPMALNSLQYWITDNFLQFKKLATPLLPSADIIDISKSRILTSV